MNTDCVTVTTVVALDPDDAFAVFTDEISAWWKPKAFGIFRSGRSGTLKFEDGCLVEIDRWGELFEIGKVLAWEPPKRLVVEWRQEGFAPGDRTEVEVRFEPARGGTRVTVEHRGRDALAASHPARHGYTGDALSSIIGLRWADALTVLKAHARSISAA